MPGCCASITIHSMPSAVPRTSQHLVSVTRDPSRSSTSPAIGSTVTLAAMAHDVSGNAARKRPRLSENRAALPTRRSVRSTNLEVDHMMLEYMVHNAINQSLASPSDSASGDRNDSPRRGAKRHDRVELDSSLDSIDDLLKLMRTRNPAWRPDPQLRFSLILLKFSVSFTQRHNPERRQYFSPASLSRLRAEDAARARRWIGDISRLPTAKLDVGAFDDPQELPLPLNEREHWQELRWGVPVPRGHDSRAEALNDQDHLDILTLLDLLPAFMEMSAAFHDLFDEDASVTARWMRLAAAFARDACLEQYLACGASGADVLDQAFAWGCKADESPGTQRHSRHLEGDDHDARSDRDEAESRPELAERHEIEIETMFRDAEDELAETANSSSIQDSQTNFNDDEVPADWARIRDEALADLSLESSAARASLRDHLCNLARKYPHDRLDADVRSFLARSASTIPKPVLVQLESGKLDGMTQQETDEFLQSCGVNRNELF